MDRRDAANRDLLIGLLALQNGLVDQSVLVAAFRAWTRHKSRPIAELLAAQGPIDADERAILEDRKRDGLRHQHRPDQPRDDSNRGRDRLLGHRRSHGHLDRR
jgi:hypothetical protein